METYYDGKNLFFNQDLHSVRIDHRDAYSGGG
jgi:hypothetical protein